jgi:hypothetical protein
VAAGDKLLKLASVAVAARALVTQPLKRVLTWNSLDGRKGSALVFVHSELFFKSKSTSACHNFLRLKLFWGRVSKLFCICISRALKFVFKYFKFLFLLKCLFLEHFKVKENCISEAASTFSTSKMLFVLLQMKFTSFPFELRKCSQAKLFLCRF